MCIKEKRCNAWISLESLGISQQFCLNDSRQVGNIEIECRQSIFNQALYIDLPAQKLLCVKNVSHGKFGYIDLAQYDTKDKRIEVYVKRPILPGKSLLYEACIQKLVGENLAAIGFPTGAPSVVNIFRLRDNSICFAMEQINGAITLDRFLDSVPNYNLPSIIIDCLLQLSAMVWHLDTYLGLNHRDLKPSNFLIKVHDSPKRKVLQIENEILEIDSRYGLTLIDFGFSCLGSTETHISNISLSTVYSKSDPCPKEGRDMYIFIAFLYIDYHTKLPPKLLALFESWLEVSSGSNLCNFMRKDKENCKKWLYFMTGNEKIKKFNSRPYKIVNDLQEFIHV